MWWCMTSLGIVEAMVSVQRLQGYFLQPEIKSEWAYPMGGEGEGGGTTARGTRKSSDWEILNPSLMRGTPPPPQHRAGVVRGPGTAIALQKPLANGRPIVPPPLPPPPRGRQQALLSFSWGTPADGGGSDDDEALRRPLLPSTSSHLDPEVAIALLPDGASPHALPTAPFVLHMYPECVAVASEITCTWGGQVWKRSIAPMAVIPYM